MASPTVTQNTTATASFAASLVVTGIAFSATDALVIGICWQSNSNSTNVTITSVTSSGLTWTKRSSQPHNESGVGANPGIIYGIDIWTAPLSSQNTTYGSGNNITVNFSGSMDGATAVLFGVAGLNAAKFPTISFDTNGNLTTNEIYAASGSHATVTYSTNQADDLLLGFTGGFGSPGFPAGWTTINQNHINPTNWTWLNAGYKSVSATQSSQTAQVTDWGFAMVDAITSDATLSPTSFGVYVG